jgi:hypothetical protein
MKIFESQISLLVLSFLEENIEKYPDFQAINQKIYTISGITFFFSENSELSDFKLSLNDLTEKVKTDRTEYGDFQTNTELANKTLSLLSSLNASPEVIIEPTCGKGTFIISALRNFNSLKYVLGVEIYKPYIWETKFAILHFFLENPQANKPEIELILANVFDFDFVRLAEKFKEKEVFLMGNPPWVTSAQLSTLESKNLPQKSNFKKQSGLNALTGKGNFDIAETILLNLLEIFQQNKGFFAFLVKNAVIKNIVFEQKKNKFTISNIEQYKIDAKKEFNAAVEASLFLCQLNKMPTFSCNIFDFYDFLRCGINSTPQKINSFGWQKEHFVSDFETYSQTQEIDGKCPFEWRQGIKHDCSKIMELSKEENNFINGLNEKAILEEGLIYAFLKSSDLKNTIIENTRKYIIVTQRKIGAETDFIKEEFPQTYAYLHAHKAHFKARKSRIYVNKPPFSIFGVGDYSFQPFKVAISGLYKKYHFSLVLPQDDKPIMLDDTCYFLGFSRLEFAVYAVILLNSPENIAFLKSITFEDAKRTFTKEVLMRINLLALARKISFSDLENTVNQLNIKYSFALSQDSWEDFLQEMEANGKK